ncbi:DUF4959 domain-containing protein [Bacteroides bouchesdurhonensis]
MKKIYYGLMLLLSGMFMITASCSDDDEGSSDKAAPGQISNVRFVPNYGGGYFLYDIPDDPDFLYVRADYTVDSGEKVSKTSSTYTDTLFIEGFGQVKEYEVKLYSVDRNGNVSVPVVETITPMEANTNMVASTLKIRPGFSALIAEWTNELKQTVDVYVRLSDGEAVAEKVLSSNSKDGFFLVENLQNKDYTVSTYVKDQYGNVSGVQDCGTLKPLADAPLSKSSWTFLANQKLYGNRWNYDIDPNPDNQQPYDEYLEAFTKDSLRNAPPAAYEGRIEKFWDDVTYKMSPENYNIFNTGEWGYPYSYFIDLGRTVRGSRVRYWQRLSDKYGNENVQTFQLYISDDKDPTDGITDWEFVGTYKIIKPADSYEADQEAIAGHEFILYPKETKYTKPFRYLRFKAIKGFSERMVSVGSEITLYGLEGE